MSRPGLRVLYVGALPPEKHSVAIVGGLLVAGLDARGHRVRAIGLARPRATGSDRVIPPSVPVTRLLVPHAAPVALMPEEPRRELGARLRAIVAAEVADHRPDVLLVNGTHLAEFLPSLATAHALPTVLTLHGGTTYWILDGTIPETRGRAIVAGLRRATQLVAVAPHLATALRSLGLERILAIGNPVDVRRFAPGPKDQGLMTKWSVAPDDVVVAHLSRLVASKRPLDIVHSAEQTLEANPRLLYLVLGDGPLRDTMERTCARLGMADRFRFVGWVGHAAVPDYLGLADIVVMPSELESQSLVYLETQACGRVLLASDIPAARGVIADGQTGLLFRMRDVPHLAARTLEAAADPDFRAALGVRARQAAEGYALEAVVAAYEAVFEEVLARHRG